MDRRRFLAHAAGATAFSGCAGRRHTISNAILTPVDVEKTAPKPVGDMPVRELGQTGITISRFGFGSHMQHRFLPFTKEREFMVREAHDMGVTLFDVYDYEGRIYQYEPMGRYLAPVMNDVVVSITMHPNPGLSVGEEMERDLRLFGRDHIDMVRLHAWSQATDPITIKAQIGHRWEWWEPLFRFREKGYIRAVGMPVHHPENLREALDADLPIDYILLPVNFYHNWYKLRPHGWEDTIGQLRRRGVGIVAMKPFLGDRLATSIIGLGGELDRGINTAQASLRWVFSTDPPVDAVIAGMQNPFQLNENLAAAYHPDLSDDERNHLDSLRNTARIDGVTALPPHDRYHFLTRWALA